MANEEHLRKIWQGVGAWNSWRKREPHLRPDLSGAQLITDGSIDGPDFIGMELTRINLKGTDLGNATLTMAQLDHATLEEANLDGAFLGQANLAGADLREASLNFADLSFANLEGANLSGVELQGTILDHARLSSADFSRATIRHTKFCDTDLSGVKGLINVHALGPSSIGIDTIYNSKGNIPEAFLRTCGVPENFITYMGSLTAGVEPIQFFSCFISYSHQDKDFSDRLYSRMQSENLRVWYAPLDMKGGRKLHEEIFRAIQIHDKLLLVLSENSMRSDWLGQKYDARGKLK